MITDYELHPLWLARVPNILCIPPRLLQRGELDRLKWQTGCQAVETGIPCNPRFRERISTQEARQRLHFRGDIPLILVMGGGLGCGPFPSLVKELSHMDRSTQIQVLTGKNEKLYQDLSRRFYAGRVRVDSYREDVSLLMDAADLLVTKPGGLSVTEAMVKQVPMLLFEAFPGQEIANQKYLVRQGVALHARPETVGRLAKHLLTHPEQRKEMAKRLGVLARPNAARRIVKESLQVKRLFSVL